MRYAEPQDKPWVVRFGGVTKDQMKNHQPSDRACQMAMAGCIPILMKDPYAGLPLAGRLDGTYLLMGEGWDVSYKVDRLNRKVIVMCFGDRTFE